MSNVSRTSRTVAHTLGLVAIAASALTVSASVTLPTTARAAAPEACVQQVMNGGVNWGGGTSWQRSNAVALCQNAQDTTARISCFQGKIASGVHWSNAISSCQSSGVQAAGGGADINGRNVGIVRFNGGTFEQRGGRWVETGASGQERFSFNETGRDEWSVYLHDTSRNVRLQLDLWRDLVLYEGDPLYPITSVALAGRTATAAPATRPAPSRPATSTGATPGTQAHTQITRGIGRQCVKGKFGVGYAGTVRWYHPEHVVLDPVTGAMSLRPGARVYKQENVPVFQESCVDNGKKMIAQVSVLGGEFANGAITIAAGTAVAIGTGIGGAVACVGTVGIACPAAAAGIGAAVAGTVSAASLALPDAKETFYLGAPKNLGLYGTVWNPSAAEE